MYAACPIDRKTFIADLGRGAFALAVVVMLAGQTAAFGGDIFRSAPSSANGGSGSTSTGTAAAPVASTIASAKLLHRRERLDVGQGAGSVIKVEN